MDQVRRLPPLVRGKLTGFFDFFVDEIKIFSNIFLLTDSCDIAVQVQWWGETVPFYIRPEKLYIMNKQIKYDVAENYYHSARYEIKTTLTLFKSYLRTCEVLELAVIKTLDTSLIGSAFLKNLLFVMNKKSEPIVTPLINYSGDEIGEVKIHTNFFESIDDTNIKNTKKTFNPTDSKDTHKYSIKTNDINSNNKAKFTCKQSKSFTSLPISRKISRDVKAAKSSWEKSNKILVKNKKPDDAAELENTVSNDRKDFKPKSSNEVFPEVKLLSDSSKVLYFNSGIQKKECRAEKENIKKQKVQKNKTVQHTSKLKKAASDSTLDKQNVLHNQTQYLIKSPKNPSQNLEKLKTDNYLPKVKVKTDNYLPKVKVKTIENENLATKKISNSSAVGHFSTSNFHSDNLITQNALQQELINCKILDYLLGCEMSKEEEESALNNLKKMSLPHDFVSSINEICSVSKADLLEQKTHKNTCVHHSETINGRVNNLNFNLLDPIEKNYFEKFFKNSSQSDVENIEFLTISDESFVTEKQISTEKTSLSDISPMDCAQRQDFLSNDERLISQKQQNYLVDNVENLQPCINCNYHKKLEELDLIIDSLKNFGKKVVPREKFACKDFVFKQSLLDEHYESSLDS